MSAEPGFRQYDFFVDGRSFFSFPKVYRLGLTGSKTMSPDQRRQAHPVGNRSGLAESSGRRKSSATNIATIEAPHNPDEVSSFCVVVELFIESILLVLLVELKLSHHDFFTSFSLLGGSLPPRGDQGLH